MRKKLPVKFTKLSPFDYNHELGIKKNSQKKSKFLSKFYKCVNWYNISRIIKTNISEL